MQAELFEKFVTSTIGMKLITDVIREELDLGEDELAGFTQMELTRTTHEEHIHDVVFSNEEREFLSVSVQVKDDPCNKNMAKVHVHTLDADIFEDAWEFAGAKDIFHFIVSDSPHISEQEYYMHCRYRAEDGYILPGSPHYCYLSLDNLPEKTDGRVVWGVAQLFKAVCIEEMEGLTKIVPSLAEAVWFLKALLRSCWI